MSNKKKPVQFPTGLKQYEQDKSRLRCQKCDLFFEKEQCIIYTTITGNMTYPICPVCKIKHPLREKPRYKKHWKKRIEYKRI